MTFAHTTDKRRCCSYRTLFFCILTIVQFTLSGCAPHVPSKSEVADRMETAQKQMKIKMDFMQNPDTDAWHEQRKQIAQALGQRDYEANFSRVFDSLVLAVSSLELNVDNMERQSGYVKATGSLLPATESKALRKEMKRQWAAENGFDPAILDKKLSTYMQQPLEIGPSEATEDVLVGIGQSLTFQLVRLGDNRTRVNARFSNVFFPDEMRRCYERVWQAVDKQIFVDKNTDGKPAGS